MRFGCGQATEKQLATAAGSSCFYLLALTMLPFAEAPLVWSTAMPNGKFWPEAITVGVPPDIGTDITVPPVAVPLFVQ